MCVCVGVISAGHPSGAILCHSSAVIRFSRRFDRHSCFIIVHHRPSSSSSSSSSSSIIIIIHQQHHHHPSSIVIITRPQQPNTPLPHSLARRRRRVGARARGTGRRLQGRGARRRVPAALQGARHGLGFFVDVLVHGPMNSARRSARHLVHTPATIWEIP